MCALFEMRITFMDASVSECVFSPLHSQTHIIVARVQCRRKKATVSSGVEIISEKETDKIDVEENVMKAIMAGARFLCTFPILCIVDGLIGSTQNSFKNIIENVGPLGCGMSWVVNNMELVGVRVHMNRVISENISENLWSQWKMTRRAFLRNLVLIYDPS